MYGTHPVCAENDIFTFGMTVQIEQFMYFIDPKGKLYVITHKLLLNELLQLFYMLRFPKEPFFGSYVVENHYQKY